MKVAAFEGTDITGRLIRFKTAGKYSHVAFLLDDETTVIEAQIPKVVERLLRDSGYKSGTVVDIFTYDSTPEQEAAMLQFVRSQIGKPYDLIGILGFITNEYNRKLSGKWFCSELLFAAFTKFGLSPLARIIPPKVDPNKLMLSKMFKFEKTIVL